MPYSSTDDTELDALLAEEFIEETHFQAFAEALQYDESVHEQQGDATVPGSPIIPISTTPRIRKVAALSDFAPVNLRVRRKSKKERKHEKKSDWLFVILRWPLLAFIFFIIAAQFGFYIIIRQLVNAKEWFTAWSGQKGRLRKQLRAARNYEEWKAAASTLDQYLQFDEWKKVDEDPYYDWKLVRKVRRSLRTFREQNDVRGCLGVLETCIRSNFAGVESSRLYSETYLGTKDRLEAYYDELEKSLEFIRETPDLSLDEKKKFFKSANTNLGLSALCLSGGAAFGYYHFGVVRAFVDAGLLPRVVTGTSAGALIAALTCTRTDEELRVLLAPKLAARLTACEEPFSLWAHRVWKTGARFDSLLWARKCSWFTRGSLTFKESYLRTGRVLNVTVIPADRHSPTKVLNYMTAPDTVIWSALLASAAVPGILNPVVLMQKLKDGRVVPWNWGSRFKDGSLRVDIPVQALNLYFNVTHPIVSQVNPHVHLFFFAPRGAAGRPVAHRKGKGKGWRGNFLLSAAEQWLKHELTKNFKVIRDLELLPQLLGQDWSSVFLQRFDGAVTIWPKTRFMDWIHILTDPDPEEMDRLLRVGQEVTWPKLHMIHNRMRLENQILIGRQAVRYWSRVRTTREPSIDPAVLNQAQQTPAQNDSPPPGLTATPLSLGSAEMIQEGVERVSNGTQTTPAMELNSYPLSVDTDAEMAFANGSRWFFKRNTQPTTGADPRPADQSVLAGDDTGTVAERPALSRTSSREARLESIRSATYKRKWASELLPSPPPHDRVPKRPLTIAVAGKEGYEWDDSEFLDAMDRRDPVGHRPTQDTDDGGNGGGGEEEYTTDTVPHFLSRSSRSGSRRTSGRGTPTATVPNTPGMHTPTNGSITPSHRDRAPPSRSRSQILFNRLRSTSTGSLASLMSAGISQAAGVAAAGVSGVSTAIGMVGTAAAAVSAGGIGVGVGGRSASTSSGSASRSEEGVGGAGVHGHGARAVVDERDGWSSDSSEEEVWPTTHFGHQQQHAPYYHRR